MPRDFRCSLAELPCVLYINRILTVQYYNFTLFAMMLNELNDKLTSSLPPTDSRLRPDIRKMESGDIGESAELVLNRLSFELHADISVTFWYLNSGKGCL